MSRPKPDSVAPEAVRDLAPWFHNLHLPDATQTAPDHPLGDFPACKWALVTPHLPENLDGWTVLDIGCNAGFYAIELARRGAKVTAVDSDPHFLRQARWAIREFQLEDAVELKRMQVYDLAHVNETFDLVLFLGVFYHLRHPLLALDIVAEKTKRLLLFQSLTMPGDEVFATAEDYEIHGRNVMENAGWPKMAFIEKSLAGDATNWWAPNHACIEAMLRSTGMMDVRRISHETYLCHPGRNGSPHQSAVEEELRAATGRLANNGQPGGG